MPVTLFAMLHLVTLCKQVAFVMSEIPTFAINGIVFIGKHVNSTIAVTFYIIETRVAFASSRVIAKTIKIFKSNDFFGNVHGVARAAGYEKKHYYKECSHRTQTIA